MILSCRNLSGKIIFIIIQRKTLRSFHFAPEKQLSEIIVCHVFPFVIIVLSKIPRPDSCQDTSGFALPVRFACVAYTSLYYSFSALTENFV